MLFLLLLALLCVSEQREEKKTSNWFRNNQPSFFPSFKKNEKLIFPTQIHTFSRSISQLAPTKFHYHTLFIRIKTPKCTWHARIAMKLENFQWRLNFFPSPRLRHPFLFEVFFVRFFSFILVAGVVERTNKYLYVNLDSMNAEKRLLFCCWMNCFWIGASEWDICE